MPTKATCSVEGCSTPVFAKGCCQIHYARIRRHGDPHHLEQRANGTSRAFFEEALKLETDECIIWPHIKAPGGYGIMVVDGKNQRVTRLALERTVGPPPEGRMSLAIHGPCHNPSCFNPRHLSWGSARKNRVDQHRDGSAPKKLTDAQVIEIRERIADGEKQRDLAKEFGISAPSVQALVCRRTYRHVKQP